MAIQKVNSGDTILASKFNEIIDAAQITEVTYAQLKAKRDGGTLVPGAQYRITDYACTTTQDNTQSAGHAFDIIVVADSESTLNENARAIQHSGDTYFANSDLSAWELKYSLDNDTNKFAWASSDGTGVIFYMKDEWSNECPYDFKNIQFKRYKIKWDKLYCGDCDTARQVFNGLKTNIYTSSNSSDTSYMSLFFGGQKAYDGDNYKMYVTGSGIKNSGCYDEYTDINGNTVETDSFDDDDIFTCLCMDCDNDILAQVDASILSWFYTFSKKDNYSDIPTDASVSEITIYSNSMDTYKDGDNDNKETLHNNIFIGTNDYANKIGTNCYNNTFGNDCYSNTFGNNNYGNTFGNGCESNTFGNDCYSNTFGNSCYRNTFGNGCESNTFGNNNYGNTFGNSCGNNTFGNYCNNNTFGNGCQYNTFGNDCYSNTFGNGCQYNTFGNDCRYNTFGNWVYYNTFGNYCYYNTFGNDCYSNTFGNYFYYNTIHEDVQYLNFTTNYTTSDSSKLQHLQILNGFKYSSLTAVPTGITVNASYCQMVGFNTSGTFTVKNPLDA